MEVICINDTFDEFQLKMFDIFGVKTPRLNGLYTIRDVINHAGGEGTGILLMEIVNQPVPVDTAFGTIWRETTFSIKRFALLNGEPLKKEYLRDFEPEVRIGGEEKIFDINISEQ